MKRYLVLTLALAFVAGSAWADVAIANSMGEPDSNRAGEDLPEWIETDGDESVDETDTAGDESTASMKLEGFSGGEIFNDHYDDPFDVSCCAVYVNMYIKATEEITDLNMWGTGNGWSTAWGFADLSGVAGDFVVGEWNYVSLLLEDADYTDGLADFATYNTHGIYLETAAEADVWLDHWTFSDTSEEGMLTTEPQVPPEAIDVGDEAMPLGMGAFQLNVPFFLDVDEAGSSWGFVGLHNNLDTELEIGVIYFNSEGDQLRFDENVSPYNTAVIPAYASVAYRPVGDLPAALPQTIANRPQHVDAIADGEGDTKNNGAIVIMWDGGDAGALQGRYLQVNGADSSAYLLPAGVAVAK